MKYSNTNMNSRNGSRHLIRSLSATAVLAALSISVAEAKSISTDFDNDGRDAFVVGDHLADGPGTTASGHVAIIQPDRNGEMRADLWSHHRLPVVGGVQSRDRFGESVVVGDFNGDGFLDMAVGAPRASIPTRDDAP